MEKKKWLAAALVASGLGLAFTGSAQAVQPRFAAEISVDAVWYYHSSWPNENACRSTGKSYVDHGLARAWFCEYSPHPQIPLWNLYLLD
ncbi:hypothetical protein L3Q67_31975 [Saccharothrix sp. AJ9571]|nr:hypothetical protein L3Q67_31975 [Saccharothrix sp. AJ9571]